MDPTTVAHLETISWSALTFIAGLATKGLADSYLRRRDDLHKFLLDKRVKFLEEQLSHFYWPMYLHLEKDNLIWERVQERTQDPDSPQSKLSIQIESGVILPNHKEAVAVVESKLHLAGDPKVVDASLRYVKHVKVYEMLRAAGIKSDPVSHGEAYPKDYFPLIKERVHALQAEYDRLLLRLRPSEDYKSPKVRS